MRRLHLLLLLVAALAGGQAPEAAAQAACTQYTSDSIPGRRLFCNNGVRTCNASGCHQGASRTNPVNNINRGTAPSTIQNAATMVGSMQPIFTSGISDTDANDLASFITLFMNATPPPPACSPTASPSSTVATGVNITVTANCTNSPTSYSWTNCTSTGPTCTTSSATATSRSVSVTATNASGPSSPASITLTWQVAGSGVPVCSVTSSAGTSPQVGDTATLTASCTGSPTSWAWTGCSSTTSTCNATSASAGAVQYSVRATNGTGTSLPANITLNWAAGPTAPPLQVPSALDFGTRTIGGPSAALTGRITNTSGAAVTINSITSDNPREFPITANTCTGSLGPGVDCQVTVGFAPSATGLRGAYVYVPSSAGTARIFVSGFGEAATGVANYSGLYWAAPARSEDGWGMNVVHQGDIAFMTWFTYDANRKDYWLIMIANRTADGVFSGDLLETRAPPFNTVPYNPSGADPATTVVGTATLNFVAAGGPTFSYTVGGTTRTKPIVLQQFGTAPVATCTAGATSQAAATNFTDLWWAAPAGSENGWGINLTHQGDVVFGTWFTYGLDSRPMWLFAITRRDGTGTYTGDVFRATGTPFNAATYAGFDPGSPIGTMTLSFPSGASATMSYTVNGIAPSPVTQTKSLVRQPMVGSGMVCQ